MTNATMREDGDAEGVIVNNSKGSCWTRRIRVGKSSEERDADPSRLPALEALMRAYADNKAGIIVNPAIGTSFDSVEEAYEFYNLHSWETGFGVRCCPLSLDRTDEEEEAMASLFELGMAGMENELSYK